MKAVTDFATKVFASVTAAAIVGTCAMLFSLSNSQARIETTVAILKTKIEAMEQTKIAKHE